jgi:hypothetical protein
LDKSPLSDEDRDSDCLQAATRSKEEKIRYGKKLLPIEMQKKKYFGITFFLK